MMLQLISKLAGVALLAFVLSATAVDDSRQIAIDGQRITAVEGDVKEMKPLISQVAAIKQTVDTDHQILMAIGVAIALDIVSRLRGNRRREDAAPDKAKAAGA